MVACMNGSSPTLVEKYCVPGFDDIRKLKLILNTLIDVSASFDSKI